MGVIVRGWIYEGVLVATVIWSLRFRDIVIMENKTETTILGICGG